MTPSFLRRRLTRVLTRPPEFLYALTRHWLLLGICLLLGTSLMWTIVVNQPVIYEGRAQLLVSRNDSILAILSPSYKHAWRDRDMTAFLNSQCAILQSDSVLRELILSTGFAWGRAEKPGAIEETIRSITGSISQFLRLEDPPLADVDAEFAKQSAIEDFQLRSEVVPDRRGDTIDLLVTGTDDEIIKQELHCWIESYKSRLAEMARETWKGFLVERGLSYARRKELAARELQRFNEANPSVSESRREILTEQAVQVQIELMDLRRRIADTLPSVTTLRDVDPEYHAFVTEKARLEIERQKLLASGFSEHSTLVQSVRKQLKWVSSKLLDSADTTTQDQSEVPYFLEHQTKLEKRAAFLATELKRLRNEKNHIGDKLKQLQGLEKRYENVHESFENFAQVKSDLLQQLESPLNVQVSDEPAVDTKPVGLNPLMKLFLGSLVGLLIGVISAVFLEVVCGRVRFKHDLIDDFGLPVVSVLPR